MPDKNPYDNFDDEKSKNIMQDVSYINDTIGSLIEDLDDPDMKRGMNQFFAELQVKMKAVEIAAEAKLNGAETSELPEIVEKRMTAIIEEQAKEYVLKHGKMPE